CLVGVLLVLLSFPTRRSSDLYGYAASVPYSEATKMERVELQQTVTGTVKNANTGEALSGVTVRVKGKEAASQTDDAGNFSIAAENGEVLQARSIGFLTYEFPVATTIAYANHDTHQ